MKTTAKPLPTTAQTHTFVKLRTGLKAGVFADTSYTLIPRVRATR